MKIFAPALTSLTLTFVCISAAVAAPPSGFDARVESLRQKIGVPGMAIAIVENDKVTLAKGFGVKRLGSPERVDGRAGHYERKLETKAGEVKLRVPKLRYQPACTRLTPLPIEPSRSTIA